MSELIVEAKLSLQRALVGEITGEMRAVAVEVNSRQIVVRVYHDVAASDELWDDLEASMAEVYADFPGDGPDAVEISLKLLRCDKPSPIPMLGFPIFAHKDTPFREWENGDVW
jgi:hypothetical protein